MLASQLLLEKSQIFFTRTLLQKSLERKKLKNSEYGFSSMSNFSMGSCIRINFVANNIYCTFWSVSGKRTFRVRSAGMKSLKLSKKRLFFYGKLFLESFLDELKQWRQKYRKKDALFFFSLKIPKRFRKFIIKLISRKATMINLEYFKVFNGCKVKKKRRKKRLGFRSFK